MCHVSSEHLSFLPQRWIHWLAPLDHFMSSSTHSEQSARTRLHLPHVIAALDRPILDSCFFIFAARVSMIFVAIKAEDQPLDLERQINTVLFKMQAWLTWPRSDQQLDAIATQCTCSPLTRYSHIHSLGEEVLSRLETRTIGIKATFLLLDLVLERCDAIHTMSPMGLPLKAMAKRKRWPTCPKDLLPHGPLDTIRGWLCWLRVGTVQGREANLIVHMLHMTIHLTHPITVPYLLELRTPLIQFIAALITDACDKLEIIDTAHEDDRKAHLLDDAFFVLVPTSEFMSEISRSWFDRVQLRCFLAEDALLLLAAYSRARRLCALHRERRSKHMDLAKCAAEYNMFESTLASDCVAWGIFSPSLMEQHIREPTASVWAQTAALFGRLYRAQRCAAPDCTRTWADPLPFKRCGGCRRLTYCSRGCQKRAWDHPVAPHRAICGTIRAMCLTYGLPHAKSAADWVAYMAKKDEPRGFNETQAQFLLDQCAAQTQYELETSRTSLGSRNANRSAHARDSAVRGRAEGMMSGMQNM
jgi:hypothetical protein